MATKNNIDGTLSLAVSQKRWTTIPLVTSISISLIAGGTMHYS